MKEILIAISFLSIKLGDAHESASKFQIQNQWLGFEPAKNEEIIRAEKRLNVILPEDYKDFLKTTNGFSAPNTIEPTFMEVQAIDFFKNVDSELVEMWKEGDVETGDILERSIIVAGKNQEQQFLLIPPNSKKGKWRYWKFANWYPGEHAFESLDDYFKDVLEFSEKEYKESSKQ
ncbi:SMI1/KNR4 family protein [Chryseobacterium paludis]|uniref:SMI1/KNR4 family protein n=1 Tax=Chryseobacterium paludis TaxID=2956784 RepID=UPI0021C211A0|nr:SMI1/KNR4 family protein [Chryseobacterium paludis]